MSVLHNSRNRAPGRTSKRLCSFQSCCIVIIFVFILVIIAIGLGLGIPALLKMKDPPRMTVGKSVERILENADQSKDPCSNFYNYACGNYAKKLARNKNFINVREEISQRMNRQIEKLIQQSKTPDEPEAFRKVKDFYASCMDIESREILELEPLTAILTKLGGWPVRDGDKWLPKHDNWIELLLDVYKARITPNLLIDVVVNTNIFNPRENILYLKSIGRLGLPISEYFYKLSGTLAIYKQFMIDVATYFGADKAVADAQMEDVLQFELKLYETLLYKEETYSRKTVKELESITGLQLLDFLHAVLPYKITQDEVVLTKSIQYFISLNNLLKQTEMKVLTNYIIWRIVAVNLQYLDGKSIELVEKFHERMNSPQETNEREICLDHTTYFMPAAVSVMYVKQYINPVLKKKVNNLTNDIKDEFLRQIQKMRWMDNETLEVAVNKVDNMKFLIGYPDEYVNSERVSELYRQLTVVHNLFFQNVLNLHLKAYDDSLWPLKRTPTSWTIETGILRGEYIRYTMPTNSLEIYPTELQSMYYDENEQATFNIGALGSIIGHEFFHSIDKKGGQHSSSGDLKSWWSHQSTLNFINSSECFIKKYNSFGVNGTNTLAENMADYVGVRTAYYTFKKYLAKKGGSQKLPKSYPWSEEQLFWLSFANVFCQHGEQPFLDVIYSPSSARVNGPLSSLPEFVHDFKCSVNSDMAMKDLRCKL